MFVNQFNKAIFAPSGSVKIFFVTSFFILSLLIQPSNLHANQSTNLNESLSQYWEITDVDQTGLDITGDMSLSLWVKLDDFGGNPDNFILAKWNHVNQTSYMLTTARDNVEFWINDAESGFGYKKGFVAHGKMPEEWFHVGVVYGAKSGTMTFYIDGEKELITTGNGLPNSIADTDAPFRIGARANPSSYLDGNVDEVRIWSRTLSDSEMLNLYRDNMRLLDQNDLVAYWKFDGNGLDSSGNENHLTPYGNVGFEEDSVFETQNNSLYTQIPSPYPSVEETTEWADDEYANGDDYWCGNTIAECGCVVTSLVMLGRDNDIIVGVDGKDLNPANLNNWLKSNNGYSPTGDLIWSKAADYFGIVNAGVIETPLRILDHKVLNVSDIKTFVTNQDTSVLGYNDRKGHFFFLTESLVEGFQILDPLWYLTETTNDSKDIPNNVQDYNDEVDRGVVYEIVTPSAQSVLVEVTLQGSAELLLVDSDGNRSGFTEDGIVEEIGGSGYINDEFISSSDDEIAPEDRTKRLLATGLDGEYELHVIGTDEGVYSLSLFLKDSEGNDVIFNQEGETSIGQIDIFVFNSETGEISIAPIDRELFLLAIELATEDESDQVKRFFDRWGNKVFDEIEKGKLSQATQHLQVFNTLQIAKNVFSDWLENIRVRLEGELEEG